MTREVRLIREGETIESGEFATPGAIASHFGILGERLSHLREICQWADDQGCAQGMDLNGNQSLIVEPAE